MRATALGFATEYAAAITGSGDETMSAQDIVQMAGVFLAFLADRDGAEPALAGVDTAQPDGVTTTDQAEPASEPVPESAQPAPDQPAPSSASPIEPPPPAPPAPPIAPVPDQPAPATDQPASTTDQPAATGA